MSRLVTSPQPPAGGGGFTLRLKEETISQFSLELGEIK